MLRATQVTCRRAFSSSSSSSRASGVDLQPRDGLLRGGDGRGVAATRTPPVVECVGHARGRGDRAAVAAGSHAAAGHIAKAVSEIRPNVIR